MKRRIVVLVAAIAVLVALTGCEPKMTITAANTNEPTYCGDLVVVAGAVTPHNATPKVVLQRTSGGKWADAKGWTTYGAWVSGSPSSSRIAASVNQSSGKYEIHYLSTHAGSLHLRVRSDGNTAYSPSFYVNVHGSADC